MRRRFADLAWGQIHYLDAGSGGPAPLLMLHGGASNGRALQPLGSALAAGRRVILPDVPGCGDSDPLPIAAPAIEDFAAALVGFIDTLGLARVDLHGGHLGARIAMATALAHPGRVRRVILDGMGFYDDASRAAMLAEVAPEIVPDADGLYLFRAFQMCRDYFLFFPWFRRDAASRRPTGLPAAGAIHTKLMEVLKNGRSYPLPYRAALVYPTEAKLPLLRHPTLLAAAVTDNVFPQLARAVALLPGAATAETPGSSDAASLAATAARFAGFLDSA